MKIAVLTTGTNNLLIETIKKRGHEPIILNPRYVYQYISENERGNDRMYYGMTGDRPEKIKANDIDAVIPRIGSNVEYGSAVLRFLTENLGVWSVNNPWGLLYAQNKAWSLQRISDAGIRVPRTIIAESPNHVKWIIDRVGSLPVIIKTNIGSQGKTVGIIDTKRSANSMLEFALNSNLKVLIEEYIESESSDVRAWVVGDRVPIAMKRLSVDGDFRANISRGGKGERYELSKEDERIAIKAAHCMGLNLAGVDLMKCKKTGKTYCIEVNANPGTMIVTLTKYNVWNDVIEYIETSIKTLQTTSQERALYGTIKESIMFDQANIINTYVDLVKAGKKI